MISGFWLFGFAWAFAWLVVLPGIGVLCVLTSIARAIGII